MNTTESSNSKSSKTQTSACLFDCDLTYSSKLVRQLTHIIDNKGRNPRQERDFMVENKNKSENSKLADPKAPPSAASGTTPFAEKVPATVKVAPDGTVKVSPESPTVIDVPVFGLILSTFTSLIC